MILRWALVHPVWILPCYEVWFLDRLYTAEWLKFIDQFLAQKRDTSRGALKWALVLNIWRVWRVCVCLLLSYPQTWGFIGDEIWPDWCWGMKFDPSTGHDPPQQCHNNDQQICWNLEDRRCSRAIIYIYIYIIYHLQYIIKYTPL